MNQFACTWQAKNLYGFSTSRYFHLIACRRPLRNSSIKKISIYSFSPLSFQREEFFFFFTTTTMQHTRKDARTLCIWRRPPVGRKDTRRKSPSKKASLSIFFLHSTFLKRMLPIPPNLKMPSQLYPRSIDSRLESPPELSPPFSTLHRYTHTHK